VKVLLMMKLTVMMMMMMMMMMMTWKMNKSYFIYLEYEIYSDDDVDDSDMMNLTFKKYIKVVILEFFL